MKLSVRSEYALCALVALGESYDQGVVRIQEVSERQGIPKRFLEQILNDLRLGGFVESRRGMSGGYRLARAPQEITLGALLEHLQSAEILPPRADSRSSASSQSEEATMAVREVMQEARDAMRGVLERITLRDLCERARRGAESSDYVI